MNPNNLVCRTCLGIISEGKIAHNIDDENGIIKNVRNIREMIMFCVPEMDIYVSISPVICESCIGTLVSVYNFKIRCLRVENAIRSYIVANNVLEGSCVNLNNVVRQQIVEALKQKNWPPEFIKQYVDEHLCTSKLSAISPSGVTGEVLRAVTTKLGVPRMPGNTGPRHPPLNLYENPPVAANIFNLSSTPSPSNYPFPSMEIPHRIDSGPPLQPPVALPGAKYISVSKNLMPPRRPEHPFSPPPYPTPAKSLGPLGSPWEGEFQHNFLNSLQLTSNANGGRQEAVLLNAKQKAAKTYQAKKSQKTKKSSTILGSLLVDGQNAVLPMSSKNLNTISLTSLLEDNSTKESESVLNPFARVSPTSGIIRDMMEQEVNSLRNVRKTPSNKNTKKGLDSEVINIEDDDDNIVNGPIVERIGNNEMLIMNFDEGDNIEIVNSTKQASNAEPDFRRTIRVEVPMIDKETMKRKLTPEDVIEEIESKRRRLTVKLSNRLPYLHKNKKLVVKVRQDRFFTCKFCKFTALRMKAVKKHYWTHHKVCALCNFKCNKQNSQMTYHIYSVHREAVEEAIRQKEEKKPEFYCYLCNFTGLSGADLRDHRFRVHLSCDSTGMYQCPVITCTKELAIAYDMISHIEAVHDKTRNTQCPLCNTKTSSKYSLGKHLETHRWSRITCQFCGHIFKNTMGLKTHIKNRHPETENFSGMVSVNDTSSCNDDFIVTLDNLQPSQATSDSQAALNTPRIEDRNLDEYEFALPSLSEMLCDQTLIEQNQQGECTVITKAAPIHKKKSVAKTTKKRPRKPEKKKPPSDLDDCLIVNQEIETVDVSDEEEHSHSNMTMNYREDESSDSDVIEINDEDDNDCVVVETSAEQASGVDQTPRDESETDTCSELSEAARHQTPQGAVSENQTDSCSELTATDILAAKKAYSEGSLLKEKETRGTLQSDSENVNTENDATCLENKNEQSNEDASSETEKNNAGSTPDSEKDKSEDNAESLQGAENETDTCSELSATDILPDKKALAEGSLVKEKETQMTLQSDSENVNTEIDAVGLENKNEQSNEEASSGRDKNNSTVADKNNAGTTPDSEKDESDDNAERPQTPQGAENVTDTYSELSATEIVAGKTACNESNLVTEKEDLEKVQSPSGEDKKLQKQVDLCDLENKNDQSNEEDKNNAGTTPDSEKDKSDDNAETPQTPQGAENVTDTYSELSATDIVAGKMACNESNLVTEKEPLEKPQSPSGEDKNLRKEIDLCDSENKNDQSNEEDSFETEAKESTVADKNYVELSDSDNSNDESQTKSDKETSPSPKQSDSSIASKTECESKSQTNEELDSVGIDNSKKGSTDGTLIAQTKNIDDEAILQDKGSESMKNSEDNTSDPLEIQKPNAVAFENEIVDSEEPMENVLLETNPENSDLLNTPVTENESIAKKNFDTSVSTEHNKLETSEADPNVSNRVEGTNDVLDTDIHMEDVTNVKDSQNTFDSEVVKSQSSLKIDAPETNIINSEAIANEIVMSESDQLTVNQEPQNKCDEANLDSQNTLMEILEVADNIREDCHSTVNVSDHPKSKEKSLEHEPEDDSPSDPTATEDNFVVLDEI